MPIFRAKLMTPIREKGPMVHFLPARIEWEGLEPRVTQVRWQGSGDVVAVAQANGFVVVGPERPEIAAGRVGRTLSNEVRGNLARENPMALRTLWRS